MNPKDMNIMDKNWFRRKLQEAKGTYVISIPKSMTFKRSHEIAAEVKKEKEKELEMKECTLDECTCHLDLDKEKPQSKSEITMRKFDTGATRNTDTDKLDYEGFFSPLVLKRCAEYLNKHRLQADGEMRDSDNWQKGIPFTVYMKSKWRHFMDTWTAHRCILGGGVCTHGHLEDSLCAEIFNTSGYLHELLKEQIKE